MDFARKQLEKYGWTDGKGLGKHENGISDALKPKIKRSVTGVGHNAAQDFTEHWWTTLYNKAASNVEVEQENGKTKKIKTKDSQEFEITNSTWKLHRKKNKEDKGEYKNFFVKTAVLANGGSKVEKLRESDSEEELEEKKDVFKMSDEQLFAACGGRTAHKGARFGLKATGKLARIKQQEEKLLNLSKYSGYSHAKKHKLKNTNDEENLIKEHDNDDSNVTEENKSSKKEKNIKKSKKNDKCKLINDDQEMSDSNDKDQLLPDLKGCNLNFESVNENIAEEDTSEGLSKMSKRRKKKKLEEYNSMEPIVESTNLEEEIEIKSKKKSKRKHGKHIELI